jgi:hypothetical protein
MPVHFRAAFICLNCDTRFDARHAGTRCCGIDVAPIVDMSELAEAGAAYDAELDAVDALERARGGK